MSLFNKKRISIETFKMTSDIVDKLRKGWYSDEYFNQTVQVLNLMAKDGYQFGSNPNDLDGIVDVSQVEIGNLEVEMQFFTRRKPFSVVAGIDEAIAILQECTGYYEMDNSFVNTYDKLEVLAVEDGEMVHYHGNAKSVQPVLKVRGRYRDFGHLETALLGVMAVQTRIATNVYNVLVAAKSKQVLYFPARFDHYKMQGISGYAYWIAVNRYDYDYDTASKTSISTWEQGDWWGGKAGGTISHSSIACFLGNTAETMLQYAKYIDVEKPRIALVDFHNDCVKDIKAVIEAMWEKYWLYSCAGDYKTASRYKLFAVRPDTSKNMIDASIEPIYSVKNDSGVTPRLVYNIRECLDTHWLVLVEKYGTGLNEGSLQALENAARAYCQEIKIVVTGGFNADRIRAFEEVGVPVDIYGVGSSLLENSSANNTNNDFTADIVKVKIGASYYELAKVGRKSCENDHLQKVQ
ncbi:MAG: nicotinate phosphoribosyltransferase [Clostridia bacterium]